jgi:type I restriction enzyme R subunit
MVVGKPERATQNRIITLFREELGYRYLGDWTDRANKSNIEEISLCEMLQIPCKPAVPLLMLHFAARGISGPGMHGPKSGSLFTWKSACQ